MLSGCCFVGLLWSLFGVVGCFIGCFVVWLVVGRLWLVGVLGGCCFVGLLWWLFVVLLVTLLVSLLVGWWLVGGGWLVWLLVVGGC